MTENPEEKGESDKPVNLLFGSEIDYKSDYRCKLDSLFDIFVGISESRFQEVTLVDGKESSVKLVRLVNANPISGRINFDHPKKLKAKDLTNDGGILEIKPFIPEDKLLKSSDYLVNIRNRPAGYSMLEYWAENNVTNLADNPQIDHFLAASNQFIVFRPRDLVHYNVKYLHKLILDPLVKFVFSEQVMYDKARSDAWIRKISKDDLDFKLLDENNEKLKKPLTELHSELMNFFFKKEGNSYSNKSEKEIDIIEARAKFKKYELAIGYKDTFSFNSLKVLEIKRFEVEVDKKEEDQLMKLEELLNNYELKVQEAQKDLNNHLRRRVDHLRDDLNITILNS
jgi:hypothetical protein